MPYIYGLLGLNLAVTIRWGGVIKIALGFMSVNNIPVSSIPVGIGIEPTRGILDSSNVIS